MLGRNRRLCSPPRRRYRLDGCNHRAHDGLENRIVPREVVLPSPAPWHCRTWRPLLFVLVWTERLLSRWASGLGTVSRGLPNDQAARDCRGLGPGAGVLLGFS